MDFLAEARQPRAYDTVDATTLRAADIARINDMLAPNVAAALDAQQRTMGKMAIELPIQQDIAPAGTATFNNIKTLSYGSQLGLSHETKPAQQVFDTASLNAIRHDLTRTNQRLGNTLPIESMLAEAFAAAVQRDSAFNRQVLQPQIRMWIREEGAPNFTQLNQRVYSELFNTPADDPWLGLTQLGYTGLPYGGIHIKP